MTAKYAKYAKGFQRQRRGLFVEFNGEKSQAPWERHVPDDVAPTELVRFNSLNYKYVAPLALVEA